MAERSHIESILERLAAATIELDEVKDLLQALDYHQSDQTHIETPTDFDDSDVTEIQAKLQLAAEQVQEALAVVEEIL